MLSGDLNLTVNIEAQRAVWFILPLYPIFLIFFIGSVAETNRAPFDLAEASYTLVSGFICKHKANIHYIYTLGFDLYKSSFFVLTKSTRNNPQGVTTPQETKNSKEQELDRAKEAKELLKDEHSNAQDHDLTNEDTALDDFIEAEKNVSILETVISIIDKLL